MVDRVVERTDGTTSERVTETASAPGSTTVIERRGGGGAGLLIGLAVLVLVVIGALYLINQNNRENVKTDAITQAAKDVGGAAKDVGGAAKDAAKKVD
ncbi:hypothetical protein E5A74_07240 [Sphingomonas naasensis]|uniref:Uncharacterized protein n=1 Tax=Sphingomonas naasensis TaxID=1344951 RepID=A0A4V3QX04_9SPHN|nr:hypothetical protein [Sphingomonas naasensis]TGX44562.1 hypothetical protein E5A74_07240 [Sphingomonas naasensis]